MTTHSVETQTPPGQADILGEYSPTPGVRLTLHRTGHGAHLYRHRHPGNISGPDIAARITITDGTITRIAWDEWHERHLPVWMRTVEDWIRRQIEEVP